MTSKEQPVYGPTYLAPLSYFAKALLFILSFGIVGFSQPAWSWVCGILASTIGYALFWRILLDETSRSRRFWLGTFWFTGVQIVQFSWLASHPYLYIYTVYFSISLVLGLQFGLLCRFITFEQLLKPTRILGLSALWVLLEWSRFFILSGLSWNPSGLALTGTIYSLQLASFWGIFGLSFWVMIVNFLALKAWVSSFPGKYVALWLVAAAAPYIYGAAHLRYHSSALEEAKSNPGKQFNAVLVQTAFPVEEAMPFTDKLSYIAYVIDEWKQILKITQNHQNKPIDIVALPEFTVPFGTYNFIYPYEVVKKAFEEIYGANAVEKLPPLEEPLAYKMNAGKEPVWFVSNAYWSQALANNLAAGVIIGLEDAEEISPLDREYYSAALYFRPQKTKTEPVPVEEMMAPIAISSPAFQVERYEKRVLVPMAEYIPFEWCKDLAAKYGVQGSFTCGKQAKVFQCGKVPFAASICYEETFGDLMRQNKLMGAELIVNLTNDAWYPNSRLPQQHFDHSRLRTVESGVPLLRSCNTGLTCAVDSLGRVVAQLGEDDPEFEKISDSLYVSMPLYSYNTIYSRVGDGLILGICLFCFALFFRRR